MTLQLQPVLFLSSLRVILRCSAAHGPVSQHTSGGSASSDALAAQTQAAIADLEAEAKKNRNEVSGPPSLTPSI